MKLGRYKNHCLFNLRCKKMGLVPKCLRVPCLVKSKVGRSIAERASHAFVKERLRLSERKRRELMEDQKRTEIGLRRRVGSDVFERYKEFLSRKSEKTFQETKAAQNKKVDMLIEEKARASIVGNKVRENDAAKYCWVVNFSGIDLTECERSVLEKGLNFSLVPRRVPTVNIFASVESALKRCDVQAAELARGRYQTSSEGIERSSGAARAI